MVVPAVNEVLKAITAKYTAEQSVTNRALISDGLIEGLNEKLNNIGLYVTDVNIINFKDLAHCLSPPSCGPDRPR